MSTFNKLMTKKQNYPTLAKFTSAISATLGMILGKWQMMKIVTMMIEILVKRMSLLRKASVDADRPTFLRMVPLSEFVFGVMFLFKAR